MIRTEQFEDVEGLRDHRHHADVDAFRESLKADPSESVHTVGPAHDCVNLLIAGRVGIDGRGVPVFFNGATPERHSGGGPFFSGGGVGLRVAPGYVSISDPAVDRNGGVRLGWYTGKEDTSTPTLVVAVLDALAEAIGQELVLVGGDGGGFAALYYAGRTTRQCSAFVWNPQTDILAYNRNFVDAHLALSFPSTFTEGVPPQQWRAAREKQCERARLTHSVVSPAAVGGPGPRRLLYLQNASDWHVGSHAVPYVQGHGFRAVGTGSYLLDEDRCVQVAGWGEGHVSPGRDLLVSYMSLFLDGARSALDIGRAMAYDERCDPRATTTAPMDLRAEGEQIVGGISAQLVPGSTTVRVSSASLPAGYGGLCFGLVQSLGQTREQVLWFVKKPDLEVAAGKLWPGATLAVAVRDGYNHHLGFTPVASPAAVREVVAPAAAPSPLGLLSGVDATVFIYGSCVTRDAMTFLEKPSIGGYVARSPVISAMGSAPARLPDGMDIARIESAFQRRMVNWDVEKALPGLLRTVPHDVVVIDFIDERLATVRVNGGLLAVSSEAARAGLDPSGLPRLRMTDDRFLPEWIRAVAPLLDQLRGHRVVLNRVLWARFDESGNDLRGKFAVDEHNEVLQQMYAHVAQTLDCPVVEYPSELLVADSNHKWGLSPFHFTEAFYRHFCVALRKITSRFS